MFHLWHLFSQLAITNEQSCTISSVGNIIFNFWFAASKTHRCHQDIKNNFRVHFTLNCIHAYYYILNAIV